MFSKTTDLERQSLEVHTELCHVRYEQLDRRLSELETSIKQIEEDIRDNQSSTIKIIITTAGSIIASVLALVISILLKDPK